MEQMLPTDDDFEESAFRLCPCHHRLFAVGHISPLAPSQSNRSTGRIPFQPDQKTLSRQSSAQRFAAWNAALPLGPVPQPRCFEEQNQKGAVPKGQTSQPR